MEVILLLISIFCFVGAMAIGLVNIKRVNEYIRLEKRNGGNRDEYSED